MLPIIFLALVLAACVAAMRIARQKRWSRPGPAGFTEYRTDLPLDDCLDRLRAPQPEDEFVYTCTRQADGSFRLHFSLHRPTSQPVDTLYSMRLESGRRTVITLVFLREAFGYEQPVFGPDLLDRFFSGKLQAQRTA